MSVMVYRAGKMLKTDSGMVDYKIVENDDLESAIKDGWFKTSIEACGTKEEHDFTPPTREELETKAKELGIEFRSNISNDSLEKKIEKALEDGVE